MTVLKMEDKVQYKRHILTSGTITVESLHPMHIQLSAFFHSFLSHLHTYTYFKVALRQQNEHYIWHYEAFLVELPKALSVEKKKHYPPMPRRRRGRSRCRLWESHWVGLVTLSHSVFL